jgi:hypothetical protein
MRSGVGRGAVITLACKRTAAVPAYELLFGKAAL